MELNTLISELKATEAKRVLVQVPEGLRKKALEIVETIENAGITAILFADPTYGACDLADKEAKDNGCDLLVHIGHSKFYRDFETAVPVIYFPWEMDAEIGNIDFSGIKENKIGIVTTIQHMKLLNDVREKLGSAGKTAVLGGQILGCWTANADKMDVDAFLFVGTGHFHPLAVRDKPVYALDLERMRIEKIDTTLFEKKRYANIYNAKNARTFAVLVSSKEGQRGLLGHAKAIKERLQESGKKAFIVVMDEIRDDRLLGLKADAYINTACPRIADDAFSKPFVNAGDIDVLLAE